MKPERIRVKIAEFLGWRFSPPSSSSPSGEEAIYCWIRPGNSFWQIEELPDCSDLNVVRQTEILLTDEQYSQYAWNLLAETKEKEIECREYLSAPASRRCEYILKTLGLWEE